MEVFKPGLIFTSPTDTLDNHIPINDGCTILFINHGKRFDCFSSQDGYIYEVQFEAESNMKAYEALDLFNSCLSLLKCVPVFNTNDAIERIEYDKGLLSFQLKFDFLHLGDEASYLACKMSQVAERDINLRAAAIKYNVAQQIFSVHPMDLEPYRERYKHEYLLSTQIQIGYSIIVAYSILEELTFHVKANNGMPSSKDGSWNPSVLQDIENRLANAGIDPKKTIIWLSRNSFNRPFKIEVGNKFLCEWSDGVEVRDFNITIVDAILETSFIRSKIASHSNSKKANSLCLYDIDNAYLLVRTILLDLLCKNIAI